MKCWKCGGETGDGTAECARCSGAAPAGDHGSRFELDWDAIETVEDFRLVIKALNIIVLADESSPSFKELAPWLKRRPDSE